MKNQIWTEFSEQLSEAYVRASGSLRFEVVTRSLLKSISREPQRIVDVGGGFGRQALSLARAGHFVTIIDIDEKMLNLARDEISKQSVEVSQRVTFVLGNGEEASNLVGDNFDLVCCHSVIMYQVDPVPMLLSLIKLARPGALISILSNNPRSSAMRSGLQGRWREAVNLLNNFEHPSSRYLPTYDHSLEKVNEILSLNGVSSTRWEGVGIFTDHISETLFVEDPEEVFLAESLAGSLDPYRQIARCYHLLATREI